MKSWEQQEGESDTAYSHFLAFLTLGVGRSIIKAYKLTHPESEAASISGVWRDESSKWTWRKRATDHDLSLFREIARESAAIYGESIRHLGVKVLAAMSSDEVGMRPATWADALEALGRLVSLFPGDVMTRLADAADMQGDPPAAKGEQVAFVEDRPESAYAAPGRAVPQHRPEDFDEDGFLREIPEPAEPSEAQKRAAREWRVEPVAGEEMDLVRTGEVPVYRPERHVEPSPAPVPPPAPKPPTK